MMDFIETLRSVGGVKPCPTCEGRGKLSLASLRSQEERMPSEPCTDCHGTGQVLDLAPLLADAGGELIDVAHSLLGMAGFESGSCSVCHEVWSKPKDHIVVVGPQRASNIVYEVSRQLGGTAVVAQDEYVPDEVYTSVTGRSNHACYQRKGYRLSLPIPESVTVLFVTDRMDEKEMATITDSVHNPIRWLPYVLTLVSNKDTLHGPRGADELKVISLHQEKP